MQEKTDSSARSAPRNDKNLSFSASCEASSTDLLIPAYLVSRVLLIEPLLQRRKVVEDGARIHLPLASQSFERVRPRTALAHCQHLGELGARSFISVDRAAVQRARISRFLAQSAMKLELQNKGEEITRIGNVGGYMIFCAWIEISLASSGWWSDTLVFPPEFPPRFVVIRGLNFAREYFPAPLVYEQAERKESHFVECAIEQQADVRRWGRHSIDQSNLFQIFRRDRQRNRVANRFVETVIRAVLEQGREIVVSALVEVVTKLVVNGREILGRGLNAHFDPQIILVVNVPGARVANHLAVSRLCEHRALPERHGQRLKAKRLEKSLRVADHPSRIYILRAQRCADVRSRIRVWRRKKGVDIVPFLRPHVAKQVRRNWFIFADEILSIFLRQLPANVGVQRNVQRTNLPPQAVELLRKIIGRHVIVRPPHGASIGKPHFASALIGKIDEADVPLAHGGSDGMPTLPGIQEVLRVAAGGQYFFNVR